MLFTILTGDGNELIPTKMSVLNDPDFIKIFVYFLYSNTVTWDDSFHKEDYAFFSGYCIWGDILLSLL